MPVPRDSADKVLKTTRARAFVGAMVRNVELLVNAIEHGNLGISREEKAESLAEGFEAYEALVAERQSDRERAARRVRVDFSQEPGGCRWKIADEGEGFDWQTFMNQLGQRAVIHTHPCGLFLTRMQFDEFKYNARGNIATVFKSALEVAEAQIYQPSVERLVVKLVPRPGFDARAQEQLEREFRARLGHQIEIVYETTDSIPRLENGKFRAVVSDVAAEQSR